jgi:hypothetical protein
MRGEVLAPAAPSWESACRLKPGVYPMKLFHHLAAIAAAALTLLLLATPAAAQATRTWISGVGDDANPCSRTAPCKTFAGAIAKTATGGEIDCLDPGGFGTLTITKAITLDCHLEFGSVLASGTSGISVNITSGPTTVNLIGLQINGSGGASTNGNIGVKVLTGQVLISGSQIYNFTSSSTCGAVTAPGIGVCVNGPAGAKVTIENSSIFNNGIGVVNSPSAGANQVVIEHSVVDFNTTANVQNDGAGAKTFFNADSLINSPVATLNTAGTMVTYGNNVMTGTVAAMTSNALQ